MKIDHDGTTVTFKTEPEELFLAEKSGAKSNTVRFLDLDEWRLSKKSNPKKIIVQYKQEIFLRTLTSIYFGGVVLGKVLAIFSWQSNEKHNPFKHIPGIDFKHIPSIDEQLNSIPIPVEENGDGS